jgi:hypothetical protein
VASAAPLPGRGAITCRVEVLQNRTGEVLEVTPTHCGADSRWRASLVSAVRGASPLPAPPDPRVFRRRVALEFISAAYVPGGSAEGFEPTLAAAPLDAPNERPMDAPGGVMDQLRALRNGESGSVELRITGSRDPGDAPALAAPARSPPNPPGTPLP